MIGKYNLLSRSTLAAFLITLVITVVAAWFIQHQIVGLILEQAATSAARQVSNVLDPSMTASDLKGAASDMRLGEFDDVVSRNILPGPVVRMQMINSDGKVVYSNNHDLVGEMVPVESRLKAALNGQIAFEESTLGGDEIPGEEHSGQLLLVYAPISSLDKEAGQAVYEIYYDLEDTRSDISNLKLFLWGGVLVLFLPVFVLSYLTGRLFAQRPVEAEARSAAPVAREQEKQTVQKEHLHDLTVLCGITRDLWRAGPSLDENFDVIVRAAVEELNFTFACLLLMQGDSILKKAAHPTRILSTIFKIGEKNPLEGLTTVTAVIESKEPLVVDLQTMRDLTGTERRELLFDISQTVYLEPVIVEDEVSAVIMLGVSGEGEHEPLISEKTILTRFLADMTAELILRNEQEDQPQGDS